MKPLKHTSYHGSRSGSIMPDPCDLTLDGTQCCKDKVLGDAKKCGCSYEASLHTAKCCFYNGAGCQSRRRAYSRRRGCALPNLMELNPSESRNLSASSSDIAQRQTAKSEETDTELLDRHKRLDES